MVSGITIQGRLWPEPVLVVESKISDKYVSIKGWTTITKSVVNDMIPESEMDYIQPEHSSVDMSGDPMKVFLAIEAVRYRFTSMYEPLLAVHASGVDPLPHQIEAVYKYVLRMPRIRFLLAHDPGAGKTIMAGLIIKELKMRKVVSSVLIVVPGHLKDQWRREIKDKFDEPAVVVDRSYVEAHYGVSVWAKGGTIITSIDFAKQDDIRGALDASKFDLTIVDEAHKMSAFHYGNKVDKTDRYRLGETLSRASEHLLLLTATPHRGDPENFRLLLDLLEPGFFATTEMIQESIDAENNPLFLRRAKEDMKDFDGKPLFVPRTVKTVPVEISNREKHLYDAMSEYVRVQYNKAIQSEKKRNVTFALIMLQRRLASSTYALLRSLERRQNRLQNILQDFDQESVGRPTRTINLDVLEDMSESERWQEEKKWEALSMAENREEMDEEIQIIDELIANTREVIKHESERKLQDLQDTLDDLDNKYGDDKILVFTESKDTLEYLEEKIRSWGYSTNTIHGGMKMSERINAETIFRNETRVMIATEAAGEGINLQFCHLMINYDLPWNPNRLEQRMGRVHRYGQQSEVTVCNMVAVNTREGKIMETLLKKIEKIKDDLGSDKVFDVISEVVPGTTLMKLMSEAAANTRKMDDILKDLDVTVDKEYNMGIREALKDSLATRYMNHGDLRDMKERARANKLNPEYTGEMFEQAFRMAGGKMHRRSDDMVALDSLPIELRRIADSMGYQDSHGKIQSRYPKVSFDKSQAVNENAEFVVFGHPVFEAVLEWIIRNCTNDALQGAAFEDSTGHMDGYIVFHEIELKDGARNVAGKKMVAHFVDAITWKTQDVLPSILWDLKGLKECRAPVYKTRAEKESLNKVMKSMEQYRQTILEERQRQSDIKKRYGLTSLDKLITDLEQDLAMLRTRSANGEDVRLPIHNKEEKKNQYKQQRTDLSARIEQEQHIVITQPRLVGWVRVVPAKTVSEEMHKDSNIERIGMLTAIEHERQAGRSPEDVSAKNIGYDILSRGDGDNTRYIEVKARAGKGRVSMTPNEMKVARNLGSDYYLYAVYNAAEASPHLKVVQNPGHRLPVEHVEVRYNINSDAVEKYAE